MPQDPRSLGSLAKRWLKAQTKELLTADNRAREQAAEDGEEAGRQLRDEAAGQAILSAVPGLRDLAERQEASRRAAEARDARERADEIAARPLAGVGIAISGGLDGSWAGQLPARVARDEAVGALVIELDARDDATPELAGHPFVGWRLVVLDYAGPGTYDLGALVTAREEAGGAVEPTDWALGVGGWDEALYWVPDVGPATVEVGDDERALVVRMAVTGAWGGPFQVAATLNLPDWAA